MSILRTLRYRHFHALLKPQNPLHNPYTANPNKTFSISAQFDENSTNPKKPLHVLFKEAVGLSEKTEPIDVEVETNEFKKKLRKLEEEMRKLKESGGEREKVRDFKRKTKNGDRFLKGERESNSKSLYALFANKKTDSEKTVDMKSMRMEDEMIYKELSPEMAVFVSHLYEKGYFKNANFLPRNKFDVTCFENSYGREFITYAAEKFGEDNQEIAKWLSGSDLKKVALFGCPSLGRKNIFSAKRLRIFFGIQEKMVCSKCVLKPSCKFVNQSVWKGDYKNLNLVVVMRVIILYALELVPPQLVVPDEIKASVSQLLKEVLNLSQAHE